MGCYNFADSVLTDPKKGPSRKPWATPHVIESELCVCDTAGNHYVVIPETIIGASGTS